MGKIFANTICSLSENFLSKVAKHKLQTTFDNIGKTTGVTVKKTEISYVIKGDWDNIYHVHNYLEDIYNEEVVCSNECEAVTDDMLNSSQKYMETTNVTSLVENKERRFVADLVDDSSQQFGKTVTCELGSSKQGATENCSPCLIEKHRDNKKQRINCTILQNTADSNLNVASEGEIIDRSGQYQIDNGTNVCSKEIKQEITFNNENETVNIGDSTTGMLTAETKIKTELAESKELHVDRNSSHDEGQKSVGSAKVSEDENDKGIHLSSSVSTEDTDKKVDRNRRKKFECEKCFKKFETRKKMKLHLHRIHTDEGYFCNICNKKYRLSCKRNYVKHIQMCKDRKGKTNLDKRDLYKKNSDKTEKYRMEEVVKNEEQIKESDEYKCKKCSYVGKSKQSLIKHVTRMHQNKLSCGICFKQFGLHNELIRHVRFIHADKGYQCHICNKIYKKNSARHFKKHLQSHAENGIFADVEVDKGHSAKDSRQEAKNKTLDSDAKHDQDGEKEFCKHAKEQLVKQENCSQLDEDLNIDEDLLDKPNWAEENHVHDSKQDDQAFTVSESIPENNVEVQRHEIFAFYCRFCDKAFQISKEYKKHMSDHKQDFVEPKFECEVCKESFCDHKSLQAHVEFKHQKDHFTKACYSCHFCSKIFLKKGLYSSHLESHSDELKYLCDLCGKAFKQRDALRKHIYDHEEVTLSCHICAKTFNNKAKLRIHLRIHKDTKDFICPTCGKGFTQQGALVRHERIHSGDKPFKCVLCARTFNDYSIIRRHMIMLHKKDKNPDAWRGDIIYTRKNKKEN